MQQKPTWGLNDPIYEAMRCNYCILYATSDYVSSSELSSYFKQPKQDIVKVYMN